MAQNKMRTAEPSELTNEQLRTEISRRAGHMGWKHTVLTMETLNSLYAMEEGEFHTRPNRLRTQGPPSKEDLYLAVSEAYDLEYPTREGEGVEEFTSPHLTKILSRLKQTEDQREWV